MKKIVLFMIIVCSVIVFAQGDDAERANHKLRAHKGEKPAPLTVKVPSLAPIVGQGIMIQHVNISNSFGAYSTGVSGSIYGTEGTFYSSWSSTTVDNTARALYVFDVSGLTAGSYALTVEATHDSPSPINMAVYDAEDFGLQKALPYNSADAAAAFGAGTVLETQPFDAAGPVEFVNVAGAVNADLAGGLSGFVFDIVEDNTGNPKYNWHLQNVAMVKGSPVPTMSEFGFGLFAVLLIGFGVYFVRKTR